MKALENLFTPEELAEFKKQSDLMFEDLFIYGECAYHYPSGKRIHPLEIPKLNKGHKDEK